jgi:putative transposase
VFQRKATTVEGVLTSLFPEARLRTEARAAGVEKRRRKIDVVAFFWTLVLGFGVGKLRTLAELRRTYENRTGSKIEESSFYDRFTPQLAKLLRGMVAEVIGRAAEVGSRSLAGALAGFRDLLLIDSTVIRLHDLLKGPYAGCRTNHSKAAAKLHMVRSVKEASASRVCLSPERTNDRTPWRKVGGWVKGCLLLFDLGYFGFRLFARIDENGGFFVSRMKENANPRVVAENRKWRGRSRPVVGKRLKDALVGLQREALDVMVEVSFDRRVYRGRRARDRRVFRVIGTFDAATERYHLFMTNVPVDRLDAAEIAETYRLRWQVELLFKELKGHYRLDQMPSAKRHVVEALLFAAILTLAASHALLDAVRRRLPSGRSIPTLRWAAVFDALAPGLLDLVLATVLVRRRCVDPWLLLLSQATDPNLARPSALVGKVA